MPLLFPHDAPLQTIIDSVTAKPPKAFSAQLVSDVLPKIALRADLENLHYAKYFETVLWRFFHADVSNNHLQLLLMLLCHAENSLWPILDREKLNVLIKRVLQCSLDAGTLLSSAQLEGYAFLFFAMVASRDQTLLFGCQVFPRWKSFLIEGHYSTDEFAKRPESAFIASCALHYFMVCVESDFKEVIIENGLYSYFHNVNSLQVQHMRVLLSRKLSDRIDNWEKLRRSSAEDFITMANTPEFDNVYDKLMALEPGKLENLARALDFKKEKNAPFLASLIAVSLQDYTRPVGVHQITEYELFDLPSHDLLHPSFYQDVVGRAFEKVCSDINHHALTVLARINEKKSSKYFYKVTRMEKRRFSELKVNRTPDFAAGNYILFVDIQKFKIAKARIAKVEKVDLLVYVKRADEFNSFIVLRNRTELLILDHLLAAEPYDMKIDVRSVKLNCVDPDFLSSSKKRKGDGQSYIHNDIEVQCETPDQPLDPDQTKALLSMVTQPRTFISAPRHSGRTTLINAFIETIKKNWPHETCLVVLPEAWVPYSAVNAIKVGENVDLVLRRDALLKRVRVLQDHLDLAEYSFDESGRNAMMLYYAHVLPKWDAYLALLNDVPIPYPFEDIEDLDRVVESFASVRALFRDIEQLLPLDKIDLTDPREISDFAVKSLKHVVALEEQCLSMGDYDNVVCFNECIPYIKRCKRAVVFRDGEELQLLRVYGVESEIAALTRVDVSDKASCALKRSVQLIPIEPSESHVSVAEAEACVALYKRLPHGVVVATSPYMKNLILEIDASVAVHYEDAPSADYVVVLTHGGTQKNVDEAARCARKGLYFVGDVKFGVAKGTVDNLF